MTGNPSRQIFVLHLVATPDCADAIRALRQLLKIALRRFGLRCISIEPVKPDELLDADESEVTS